MQKEGDCKKVKKIENIEQLKEGATEIMKVIFSMKNQLIKPNLTIIFISGLVGYSCQAALLEKKQKNNLFITKTKNGKNYIFSNDLNYYLVSSEKSFYNILMGQLIQMIPEIEPFEIEPFLKRVAENIGNEKYLIGNGFNPEKIFDFEFYSSKWKEFNDILKKYCKTPDEWPILFSISMTKFLEVIINTYGIETYFYFILISFENALYVSKISQL